MAEAPHDQIPTHSPRLAVSERTIERANLTDLLEFYATVDLKAVDLHDHVAGWQHTSIETGRTPRSTAERRSIVCELIELTPLGEEVDRLFDPQQERFRQPEYAIDLTLAKLK